MFSSQNMISLVFANENDTYYRDDLQKLKLDQHLWYLLHQDHFKTVYYLRRDGDWLCPRSFGDKDAEPFNKIQRLWDKQLLKWLPEQMCMSPDKAVAVVCSLQEFCELFSDDKCRKVFQKLQKNPSRTGILVLVASATAERSSQLLLSCPVFDYLGETVITGQRGGALRDLYAPLYRWEGYHFLNEFTKERVRGVLRHVIMDHPDRLVSLDHLDQLADYLEKYLSGIARPGGEGLFGASFPSYYMTFEDLYTRLCDRNVWEGLESRVARGLSPKRENRTSPILRERATYAGKCLQLKLPERFKTETRLPGESEEQWAKREAKDRERREQILNLLWEIRNMVAAPKNKPENPNIQEAAGYFVNYLEHLDSVMVDARAAFLETLRALRLCLEWIYLESEKSGESKEQTLLQIIRLQKSMIPQCESYAVKWRDYRELKKNQSNEPLYQKQVESMRNDLVGLELRIKLSKQAIGQGTWLLSMSEEECSNDWVKELYGKWVKDSQDIIEKGNSPAEAQPEPSGSVDRDDSDIVLRPSDYDITPKDW